MFGYDGTAYHGWQIQPNGVSVQETLQKSLSTILQENVEIVGAGRTDAGVHARMMVAHFDWRDDGIDCSQIVYKLNRFLPNDIVVKEIRPVAEDMHARFSAVSRTYRYYLHIGKNPFLNRYSYESRFNLDFDNMNGAAELLLHYDDFGAFCKAHTDVKTTICKVTVAKWVKVDDSSWYFEITANRFLRNMVRAVVGTLMDVGRGRVSIDGFKKIIETKTRSAAGESMPANALFLEYIEY